MPTGRGTGDVRMAWKKGRKDNEYDVNFKAGWGRSNHRRLGSTIPPPFSTLPAILTPHTPADFELWLYQTTGAPSARWKRVYYVPRGNILWRGSILLRTEFDGERRKKKKQRTDKVKKREETKKKEREEARKEAEKENQREKETRVANSSHRQTTLISGY